MASVMITTRPINEFLDIRTLSLTSPDYTY